MSTHPSSQGQTDPRPIGSVWVLLARMAWFLLGPVAAALLTYGIIHNGNGWLTGWDAAFACVIAVMVLGRWVELRSGVATTVSGAPATPAHFTRYVRGLLPVAAGVWLAANVLGNHVMS